ncbi:MAG: trypsin-like peptidase domain-containing protein [Candidatus Aminicenantes bacterium]|nr:trypsin-like peptidase domain-containing protein [Candidatus Aminicenantes bacterium]
MTQRRISPHELEVEELDKELIRRGAQVAGEKRFMFSDKEGTPQRDAVVSGAGKIYEHTPPPNEALAYISTWDLARIIKIKTSTHSLTCVRGSGYADLMDWYEIGPGPGDGWEKIKQNAGCTAAVCFRDQLIDTGQGAFILNVKNYGKTFNLCQIEPFRHQPIAAGKMCSGFLVEDDVIATAGHVINENNVTDLRFIFGFAMMDSVTPVTKFPRADMYRGVKIIHRLPGPGKAGEEDMVLVRLDCKVAGRAAAELSKQEISKDQAVYVTGYPLGLPLKYDGGGTVQTVHGNHFTAGLNVYGSSPGSPVFDWDSHEVTGIVGKSGQMNFRWTGKGWMSVIYPGSRGSESGGVFCHGVSKLVEMID